MLWAAWLYNVDRLIQNKISAQMGMSRGSVNACLANARTRSIVSIEIDPDRYRALSKAQAKRDHCRLEDFLVIPSGAGDRSFIARLGAAGAQTMLRLVQSSGTIAVTWGGACWPWPSSLTAAGGMDTVQAILAGFRGGYVNVMVINATQPARS